MQLNRVTNNAIWIISCRIAQALMNLVISMLSARYLGPSNYGLINYAASVVAFVIPVMQLGFRSTMVQDLVNHPEAEGKILGTTLTFNLITALACIVGVCSFSYLANPNDPTTWIVCSLYSVSLLFQATEMIQYWFQAKLMSKYVSLSSLGAYVLVSTYKIYLLVTQKSVFWFAISNSIDFFLISVSLFVIYHRLSAQKLSFSWRIGLQMLSKSKHFIISGLMVTVFAQTDRIMLKAMLSSQAVGYYSAAVTCAGMTSFVFAAIIDSVRPVAFEERKISAQNSDQALIKCYSLIIYLSLAQSVVFTLFSPLIIRILYGAAYTDSVSVLRLIVWYTTFSYLGPIRNIWMLIEQQQKYLWVINLSGAAANVVLNWFLIPLWGTIGAALASLITQFFTNVLVGFMIRPIRYNNTLMLKGLNPRVMLGSVRAVFGHIRKVK